jgi:hypothetical protein
VISTRLPVSLFIEAQLSETLERVGSRSNALRLGEVGVSGNGVSSMSRTQAWTFARAASFRPRSRS